MSTDKLPFGLVLQETAILLLLLVDCLLLLCYVFIVCHQSIIFITFAGTPPTIALAGTSLVTTAPAATMALSPMVTPCRMVTFAPSHTFFADVYRFGYHACPLCRVGDVIERAECGVMTDEGIVVNEDTALVLELTAHIDEHPFADMRVLAAIGIERRKHTERLRHVYRP